MKEGFFWDAPLEFKSLKEIIKIKGINRISNKAKNYLLNTIQRQLAKATGFQKKDMPKSLRNGRNHYLRFYGIERIHE